MRILNVLVGWGGAVGARVTLTAGLFLSSPRSVGTPNFWNERANFNGSSIQHDALLNRTREVRGGPRPC